MAIFRSKLAICAIFVSFVIMTSGVSAAFNCPTYSIQTDCETAQCFWDQSLNGCFTNPGAAIDSITGYTGCDYWNTNFAGNQVACEDHGCAFDHSTSTCVTFATAQATGSVYQVAVDNEVSYYNPALITGTDEITLKTRVPFKAPANMPVEWYTYAIGAWDGTNYASMTTDCVANSNPSQLPSSSTSTAGYEKQVDIDAAVWIDQYANLDFNSNPFTLSVPSTFTIWGTTYTDETFDTRVVVKNLLTALFGPQTISSDSFIRSVARINGDSATLAQLEATWRFSLGVAYTNHCPGVKLQMPNSNTEEWTVPITVIRSRADGTRIFSSNIYYITHNVQSQSISISPTSRYPAGFRVDNVWINPSDCGDINQARQYFNLSGSYTKIEDGAVVGPRSAADFYNRPRNGDAATAYDSFTSTFQDFVLDAPVSYGTGVNYQTFHVTVVSECRVLVSDGTTFTSVANANSANLIAQYGNSYSYPSYLDKVHNVFIDVYKTSDGGATYTLINNDVGGSQDLVSVTINQLAFPPVLMKYELYDLFVGLLHDTASTSMNDVVPMVFIPKPTSQYVLSTPVVYSNETRNKELAFGGLLAPLIYLRPEFFGTGVDLFIDYTTLTLTPLNGAGNPVGSTINYQKLLSLMTHSPQNYINYECPACHALPFVTAHEGSDGFSISTLLLARMVTVPFVGVDISFVYRVWGAQDSGARRLLSVRTYSERILFIQPRIHTASGQTLVPRGIVHGAMLPFTFSTSSTAYLDSLTNSTDTTPPADSGSSSSSGLSAMWISIITVICVVVVLSVWSLLWSCGCFKLFCCCGPEKKRPS
jgi:hypothetical protein